MEKEAFELIYLEGSNHQAFENTSHVCNYIDIKYDDGHDILMPFSFYITIEHESRNLLYIIAAYNYSIFVATTYQSTIHYIHRPYLPIDSKYKVILNAHNLRNARKGILTSIYYISISRARDCKQMSSYRFLIVGLLREYRGIGRANLIMLTHLSFQGSHAYYKSMYHHLTIDSSGSPLCDVIVNFQIVFTKKTNKTQDNCDIGYRQVGTKII